MVGDPEHVGGLFPGIAGTAPPVADGVLLAGTVEANGGAVLADLFGGYSKRPELHEYLLGR